MVETEQWSDMQEMLKQVREEMDDLHCSRDFWERCAIQSNHELQSTNTKVGLSFFPFPRLDIYYPEVPSKPLFGSFR